MCGLHHTSYQFHDLQTWHMLHIDHGESPHFAWSCTVPRYCTWRTDGDNSEMKPLLGLKHQLILRVHFSIPHDRISVGACPSS